MLKTTNKSHFQEIIETVESLSIDDQEMLLKVLNKRLREQKRNKIAQEIDQVRQEYQEGKINFGSVDNFLLELDQE
jgi:ribosomal protein L18E